MSEPAFVGEPVVEPPPPAVRVAVVGLGWAARSIWLRRLRTSPRFTVTAVVDPDPLVRATIQLEDVGALVLASIDELDAELVDLAVVAVPNHLHCETACRLLERGMAVFVEKPVCLTSAEADRLTAAELSGSGILLAGSAARYRADVRELYAIAGDLGQIRHLEVSWIRAHGVPDGGWFTRRRLSGGGALVDLGWHLFDTVLPLLGQVSFDQVVATTSDDFIAAGDARAGWKSSSPHPNAGDGDVEDTARGFLVTDTGVSISLQASWASHEPLDVTRIRIDGSDGTAELRCTFGFTPDRHGGSSLSRIRHGTRVMVALPDEPIGTEYDRQLDELLVPLVDPGSKGRAVAAAARTIGLIERLYASAPQSRADPLRTRITSGANTSELNRLR